MRLWLRGLVLQVLRSARGTCGSPGQPPTLPAPQKVVATWEAISLGRRPVPEYFNFAHDVLDMWSQLEKAGHRPPIPAFWWVDGMGAEVKWSFEELGEQSRKAANVLGGVCGLQPGDRVMLVLPRLPEWWLVSVACMRTGAVMIPGISQLTEKDLRFRLQASKAKCIITNDSTAPQVDAISVDCPSLQTKLLVSDSSRPSWVNFRELLRRWVALTESDIFWNTTDTGWVKAAWTLFSAWPNGSCTFVHKLPQVDAKTILNTLSRFPITTLCCVPTIFRLLVQEDLTRYQFQSLKHCLAGGEALNPDVREKWKSQTGLELHEGYGQSETVVICANPKGSKIKSGSMGTASPPYDVQIVDDEGNVLPPGGEGDIAIRVRPTRPFCFFSCYLDNPEKTAASERGDFYITGDRAHVDKDGYFWFMGRNDDVIISSSYRIGPIEVESALAEHPAVLESAVVSSPDPTRGEVTRPAKNIASRFCACSNMLWLQKFQRLCILWGTRIPKRTVHVHTRQLASLQWGYQEVPPKFNFASDVLDHWADMEKAGKRHPGPALWWVSGDGDEVKWNFSQLSELSQQTANVFSGPCGLQRGDRVAVVLPRVPEWWLVILGCMRAGLVFIPGTIQLKPKDILYRLQVSNTRAIVAGDEVAQAVDTVAPDCPALKTKILVSAKSREGWLDFKTLLRYKFPHLQHCFSGGESLLPETLENWKAQTGLDIREFYGQTETVIDDKGNVLPPGTEGDLGIRVKPSRPIGIFSGYVDNLEKTAANIRGDFWLLGDQGIKDQDGYFYFMGRADDIINSSGYRIGPSEVENALMEHPAVVEAAAVSSPDPFRGEVVKAFVVLAPQFLSRDPDQLTKELQQHVKLVTAPYKYPRKAEDKASDLKFCLIMTKKVQKR
ncbi:acyl-coenzyme A synthetase ACSM5, mitochondrial [Camelus ferus]|nr:acyl-coenzyme A synthetase ACSM5, mitochondrial [Camelus ferus]